MAPAARDVAQRQTGRTDGGASGKPGSSLPLDLGATARLDAVQNELGGWARATAEERHGRPVAHGGQDPIVHAAHYLVANLEWWRHRPNADEFLDDVEACARVVRRLARGPAELKYLGPCGAPQWIPDPGDDEFGTEVECEGDVYGRPGAANGRCKACGAEVDQAERAAWLDGEVRQRAYRASEIEDAYGIKANLIRQWATPERGLLRVHDRDFLGRARYMLGEVLDLAVQQKAKAAERAAERERRAARHAAEMGA